MPKINIDQLSALSFKRAAVLLLLFYEYKLQAFYNKTLVEEIMASVEGLNEKRL
jgi:hypothetical protein